MFVVLYYMCCVVLCSSLPTILPAHGDNTNTGATSFLPSFLPSFIPSFLSSFLPSFRPSPILCSFYPHTGETGERGAGQGKYHTINIPLKDADDASFGKVTSLLARSIPDAFAPKALVLQVRATLGSDTNVVYQCGKPMW